jgi:hypothetical protein
MVLLSEYNQPEFHQRWSKIQKLCFWCTAHAQFVLQVIFLIENLEILAYGPGKKHSHVGVGLAPSLSHFAAFVLRIHSVPTWDAAWQSSYDSDILRVISNTVSLSI